MCRVCTLYRGERARTNRQQTEYRIDTDSWKIDTGSWTNTRQLENDRLEPKQ